jgi:hypothetical protein
MGLHSNDRDIAASYLRRVHLALERKGLQFRAAQIGPKFYVYAWHRHGRGEVSVTIELISDGWALSDTGSPLSPYDLASKLSTRAQSRHFGSGAGS